MNEAAAQSGGTLLEGDKETLRSTNPALVNVIRVIAESHMEQSPRSDLPTVIYFATKTALKHESIKAKTGSMIPVIFAYYLNVYRDYHQHQETNGSSKTEIELLNQAVLSIFDLYVDAPDDLTLRQMLLRGVDALHSVISYAVSSKTERGGDSFTTKDGMQILAANAMLAQTLKQYVEPAKRKQNINYITWLHDFFEVVLKDYDFSVYSPEKPEAIVPVKDDLRLTLKSVLTQISENSPIIRVY